MVKCKKCKKYVAKDSELIKCIECNGTFHKLCTNPAINVGNEFICTNCGAQGTINANAGNAAAGGSGSQGPNPENIPEMKQILNEINNKISIMYVMKKDMETLTQSTEFLSNKYDELISLHLELGKKLKENENKLNEVINKNTYLEKCNRALEHRIQEIEQKEKNCNIELFGLEMKKDENIGITLKTIAEKLNTNCENIEKVWRLPNRKDSKPANVIVKFIRQTYRDEWLQKKKPY